VLYRLEHVRVAFGSREVLRDVTLQHNPGEKLILLGRNGTGKTTLLRVIAGDQEIEGGLVERARGLESGRIDQLPSLGAGETVLDFCLGAFPRVREIEGHLATLEDGGAAGGEEEAIRLHELHEAYERLDGYRARPRTEAALDAVGLGRSFHARPVTTLSGGERTRAALVRALLSRAPLLLLDEPTNHLDLLGVDFLARELAARDGAVLLITHDRELVDRVGGEILELHGGRLERYPAGYARYRRERGIRREQARREYELQRAEIARQEEFIRRNIAGQNTRQAQARQKMLDRVTRLEPPDSDQAPVKLKWATGGRSGDRVVEVEGLDVGGAVTVLRAVSFAVRRGERLAVVGRNGAGKSTLLRTLSGRLPALGGRYRFGTGVVPGAYDQDHAEVPEGVSVLDAMLAVRPDWAPADGRAWAGRFGFSGERADAGTETLSGGERARLALASLIAMGPNLMLLDEPTNHLDAPTCEALEEALADFPGAVILVSHDRRLLERIATDVLLLEDGTAVALDRVDAAFARIGLSATRSEPRQAESRSAPRRSALEEERRKLRRDAGRAREHADDLAAQLEELDARLREIDDQLCRPEVFSDAIRVRELASERDDARGRYDERLEEWDEAEEDAQALAARLAELETD
jgi:ATP-binding cassette subfamily F protein 3